MKARPPFLLLVLVTLSGTMALHMVLPALPDAAHGLGVAPAHLQLAVSCYVMGLAAGQLVWGPLSDARGRRPMLLAGLALYTAGGILSALAGNLPMLLAARFVQALGGCAGLALGRAMVRDTSTAQAAVGQQAALNLVIVIGPALAPVVGGALAGSFGWRSVFAALAITGALTLWLVWKAVPETTQPSGRIDMRTLFIDSAKLLRSPQFAALAIGGGIFTTALWGFLTAAPFILTRQLGEPVQAVGIYSCAIVLGAAAGNAITSWLVRRVADTRLAHAGALVSLAGAALMLTQVLMHNLSTGGLVAALMIFTCGTGLANPVIIMRALGVVPRLTGSAAGLYGFLQMVIGTVMTVMATFGDDPSLTSALLLVASAIASALCFAVALPRRGPVGG